MNPRLLLLLATVTCTALRADIYLRGVLERDGKTVVGLWDSTQRHTSTEWIMVGGTWGNFTVQSYDPAQERVRLQKDDQIVEASSRAPARIAAPLWAAGQVVILDGRRLCALHREPLIIKAGFTIRPGIELRRRLILPEFRAKFPNSFGDSLGHEPSVFNSVEVRKEFCPGCEKSFLEWDSTARNGARPSVQ